ncbi:MAG TPA: NYN domain-containing protein [Candidatus Saccharimonadales bacterium]|nr:NYN domain-containing protein [Candidatus Saccharimonadales bacterium]
MKVYIDGENCRKGLTRVLKETGDIAGSREMENYRLRDLLADVLETNDIEIGYYASYIKLPNGYQPSGGVLRHVQKIKEYSRKWVPALESQGIEYVKAGYLKVKSTKECRNCHEVQDVLQEKGVDVRIATEMLEDAYTNKQNVIVVMSSDTDLCPAIHKIKTHGAKVIYVAFADWVNRAVSAAASETVTISIAKVQKYSKPEEDSHSE